MASAKGVAMGDGNGAAGNGSRTAFRVCPLCEAGCGLEISLTGDKVGRIRGDRDDVFSHGYICPKGSTLRQLHEDPDWLRQPLVRRDDLPINPIKPESSGGQR